MFETMILALIWILCIVGLYSVVVVVLHPSSPRGEVYPDNSLLRDLEDRQKRRLDRVEKCFDCKTPFDDPILAEHLRKILKDNPSFNSREALEQLEKKTCPWCDHIFGTDDSKACRHCEHPMASE